jgi:adenine-specific DNA-methyltransferase
MTDVPERVPVASSSMSAAVLETLQELIPGAIVDGVLDAQRIADLVGLEVAAMKNSAERFGMMWAGKGKAVASLQVASMASLSPDLKESIDWDNAENVFVEGDNFEVLKLLQKAYNDQVKLIYIDPPYNTGNDFVYEDDFSDPVKRYLEVTGQVDSAGNRLVANTEVSGRKHSNWLSMMYPRLVLARNLLCDEGSIFVSIDDNEVHNLRQIMDEVFGSENFIAQMIWNSRGGGQDTKDLVLQHEYILFYARNRSRLAVGTRVIDAGSFPLVDELSGKRYKRQLARKWGSNSKRSDRPNLFYAVKAPDGSDVFPMRAVGEEGRWRWGRERFNSEIENFNVEFLKDDDFGWVAYEKIWQPEDGQKSIPFGTILPNDLVGNTSSGTADLKKLLGKNLFSYPKPVSLMKTILDIGNVKDSDIVIDFFAGSGTMGQAVVERNHEQGVGTRYLLVSLDEKTAEKSEARIDGYEFVSQITKLRLSTVHNKEGFNGASGLRMFAIAPSNFLDTTPIEGQLFAETLNTKSDNDAIAAEVLLKSGVRLDMAWKRMKLAGSPVVISDGVAVVLARKVTNDVVAASLELSDVHTVIFLEDAFSGEDSVKANAHFAFKNANKTMKSM